MFALPLPSARSSHGLSCFLPLLSAVSLCLCARPSSWSLSRIHARTSHRSLDSEPRLISTISTKTRFCTDFPTFSEPLRFPAVQQSRSLGCKSVFELRRDPRDASGGPEQVGFCAAVSTFVVPFRQGQLLRASPSASSSPLTTPGSCPTLSRQPPTWGSRLSRGAAITPDLGATLGIRSDDSPSMPGSSSLFTHRSSAVSGPVLGASSLSLPSLSFRGKSGGRVAVRQEVGSVHFKEPS